MRRQAARRLPQLTMKSAGAICKRRDAGASCEKKGASAPGAARARRPLLAVVRWQSVDRTRRRDGIQYVEFESEPLICSPDHVRKPTRRQRGHHHCMYEFRDFNTNEVA